MLLAWWSMDIKVVQPSPQYWNMRRWPRYMVEVPVRIHSDLPPRVAEAQGTSLNAGGMAVSATIELAVGQQISVEFAPPGAQQAVTARCFIRNRASQTYGVEFIAETDSDYATIGEIGHSLNKFAAALQLSGES